MFTSKTTRGFYDAAIHGSKTIVVADPEWVRPTTEVTLKPGESVTVGDTVVTNESDIDKAINVPDMEEIEPTIEIDNPDSLTPLDAVEITSEEHTALLVGQAAGKLIDFGEDGYPFLTDPAPPTEEELQQQANDEARAYLVETDWYVIRLQETGEPVPEDILAERAAARARVIE